MTKLEQFFYDNAGFSYDPATETAEGGHQRCARQLAETEQFARSQDWRFEITPDWDADESFMDEESDEYRAEWSGKAWSCVLWDADDNVLASLGGCYGDSDYERVVKAELAFEAMSAEDFSDFVPAGDIPVAV